MKTIFLFLYITGTAAQWTDNSNSDVTSARSSLASSSDGSFLTEADFATAVAKAAELSGMTVVDHSGAGQGDPHMPPPPPPPNNINGVPLPPGVQHPYNINDNSKY